MVTVLIKMFSNLDDDEKKEIANNALDIYKFFKAVDCNNNFNLLSATKTYDYQTIIDWLSFFLPFVKRSYDSILDFDEGDDIGYINGDSEAGKFLLEIGKCVKETIKSRYDEDDLSLNLTTNDVARFSNIRLDDCYENTFLSIFKEKIKQYSTSKFLNFLEKRNLLIDFYNDL